MGEMAIINCSNRGLKKINEIDKNVKELDCSINMIEIIPQFNIITKLFCERNELTVLPDMPELVELHCENNKLTKIICGPKLRYLYCGFNKIKTIELCNTMQVIHCEFNEITDFLIKIPNAKYIVNELKCNNNNLTKIDQFYINTSLDCSSNKITSIDVDPDGYTNVNAIYIKCSYNLIEKLRLPCRMIEKSAYEFKVKYLDCSHNKLKHFSDTTRSDGFIDCSHNELSDGVMINFRHVKCNNNKIVNLTSDYAETIECEDNEIEHIIAPMVETLKCKGNKIRKLGIHPRLKYIEK